VGRNEAQKATAFQQNTETLMIYNGPTDLKEKSSDYEVDSKLSCVKAKNVKSGSLLYIHPGARQLPGGF
jgi:hypothetical protein